VVEMDWVIRTISSIRSVRSDMNVPASAKTPLLVRGALPETRRRFETHDAILRQMARLQDVQFMDAAPPKGSIQTVVDEAVLILPVADIIDLGRERERLEKQIGKLKQDLKKIDQKIENKEFMSNAPEDVVEEQRARKGEVEETIRKLSHALEALDAA